jgi:lipoate-protein ligase A
MDSAMKIPENRLPDCKSGFIPSGNAIAAQPQYIVDGKKLMKEGMSQVDAEKFVMEQFQEVFKKNAEDFFEAMPQSLRATLGVSEDAVKLTDSQIDNLLNIIIKVE